MSYDLYFLSRSVGRGLSRDEFAGYFSDRNKYQVSESQALYSNEDTGVYFTFDYAEPGEDSESQAEGDPPMLPVTFNMNYFRPHIFGLEAEPEVAAFVSNFNLTVSDPQMSGMDTGE